MEQIAHRIDEDAPRLPPLQRLLQSLRSEGKIEAGFKRMAGDTAKSLGEALGVTEVAAARDL